MLPFPEIGVALTRYLEETELRRLFTGLASSDDPRLSAFAGQLFGLSAKPLRRAFLRSFDLPAEPPNWERFWRSRDEQDLQLLQSAAQLLRASIEQSLRLDASQGAIARLLLERFFNAESLSGFDSQLSERFWEKIEGEVSVGQALVLGEEDVSKNQRSGASAFLGKSWLWLSNGLKTLCGLSLAWLTGGFGLLDIIFLPLGFIGGSWLLAALYWRLLSRKAELFRQQRRRQARELFEEIQMQPLRECVRQLTSSQELVELKRAYGVLKATWEPLRSSSEEIAMEAEEG